MEERGRGSMVTIRTVGPSDCQYQMWEYFEVLDFFFTDTGRRKAILLSCVGQPHTVSWEAWWVLRPRGRRATLAWLRFWKTILTPNLVRLYKGSSLIPWLVIRGNPLQSMWPNLGNLPTPVIIALLCFKCREAVWCVAWMMTVFRGDFCNMKIWTLISPGRLPSQWRWLIGMSSRLCGRRACSRAKQPSGGREPNFWPAALGPVSSWPTVFLVQRAPHTCWLSLRLRNVLRL